MSRAMWRRSPGSRTILDVFLEWVGKTSSRRYSREASPIDCIRGGVAVSAFWKSPVERSAWHRGTLHVKLGAGHRIVELCGVRGKTPLFSAADHLKLRGETSEAIGIPGDRSQFIAFCLGVNDTAVEIAVPKIDAPILKMAVAGL